MKRYKLLKDLPTFKAGDEFHINPKGNLVHNKSSSVAYMESKLKAFPNILTDWFEEIKGTAGWEPNDDEDYWLVTSTGGRSLDAWSTSSPIDKDRLAIGNVFKTQEEAKKAAEWLKALKVLRDDTKGFKPDWSDDRQEKIGVYYSYLGKRFNTTYPQHEVSQPFYFKDVADVRASIIKHRTEWLTYFGVEEEDA